MAKCETVVFAVRKQSGYCSLALSHRHNDNVNYIRLQPITAGTINISVYILSTELGSLGGILTARDHKPHGIMQLGDKVRKVSHIWLMIT